MATTQDDAFPPVRRLLQEPLDQSHETTWTHARAVELLRSMDDLHIASGRKERLLFRLGQGHGTYGRRFGRLRAIVIGAFLMGIGGGAIASMALTKWPAWVVRAYGKVLSTSSESALTPPAVPARRISVKSIRTDLAPVQPAPVAAPDPVAAPRSPTAVRRFPLEIRAPRPPAETPSDDSALLVGATRALRIERNPARARALARRYLDRQPNGDLAEEALAISIEAAVDHRDPDAPALGARYLATFPHGSFGSLAEWALSSSK